jgi:hypothetical protein
MAGTLIFFKNFFQYACTEKRNARIFASAKANQPIRRFSKNAEIAQLVERNLAKVEVASSNLVFRSKKSLPHQEGFFFNAEGPSSISNLDLGHSIFT